VTTAVTARESGREPGGDNQAGGNEFGGRGESASNESEEKAKGDPKVASVSFASDGPSTAQEALDDSLLAETNLLSADSTDGGEAASEASGELGVVEWTSEEVIGLLLGPSEDTRRVLTLHKSGSDTDLRRLILEEEAEDESEEEVAVQRPRANSMLAAGPVNSVFLLTAQQIAVSSTGGPQLAGQHQAENPPLPAAFAVCTYCMRVPAGSAESQVTCPGCGPHHYVRYCSVACLLADSLEHATSCLLRPVAPRFFPGNVTQDIRRATATLVLETHVIESPERFRQRAFSVSCSTGPFPQILLAWARKMNCNMDNAVNSTDWFKKTGDYAIFRSEVTGPVGRYNPNADVIFT
jgi:MYND finger